MQNHIYFDAESMQLRLLDQRKLPLLQEYLICNNYRDVIKAIKTLAVRGAPAIGVAAAWACVLAAEEAQQQRESGIFLNNALQEIRAARPTAVNLMWAVDRMANLTARGAHPDGLIQEARSIQTEDIAICKKIGQMGRELIKSGDVILTHCNAGSLATAGYGTALGVIRAAWEQGKKISVIADETRPLMQGSRLTAYELAEDGIPVTVATDSSVGALLATGQAQIIITGADRIAANGDTANKIGTLGVAIMASYYHVPFYIAAPLSTIDPLAKSGADIPVETRAEEEVLVFNGARVAPQGVKAINYAFDITPAALISGIITEAGILYPPYASSIAQALNTQ